MKTFLGLLAATVLFISCKKDDTDVTLTLPEKTQTGQHTFGFLLNSNVWRNYGNRSCFPYSCPENLYGYYDNNGYIQIGASKTLSKNGSWNTEESVKIEFDTRFKGLTTYSAANNDTISINYTFLEKGQHEKFYMPSLTNPDITILLTKIDSINKILSGEFSGKMYRRIDDGTLILSTTDTIVVDDGRFDIHLNQ